MAVFKAKEVSSALLKKGFRKSEGHHHFYEYSYGDKIVAKTRMSHNDQEIDDWLISKMHKQCGISKKKFIGLVDCSVTKDDYETELKNRGII